MSEWQVVTARAANVDFAQNGIKLTAPRQAHIRKNNLAGHKLRGKMTGAFSRTSALNLRRKLACLPSDTFRLWGLTLTMPAQCYRDPEDFRKLWNMFTADVSGRLRGVRGGGYSPDIGFIWRIELTTGESNTGKVRTPHLHCVAWTNAPSDVLQLAADWCAAVERHFGLTRGSLDPQVAALSTELTSCQHAFQYVANHTSKHKEGQLGWPGRQWGIYYGTKANRERMSPILSRFDNKPVADVRASNELSEEQTILLSHGNCDLVRMCTLCINCIASSVTKENASYWCFCRVVRRLIESQLGRMAENARSPYFRKKYGVRSRRRYYASRYAKSSTLFFAPGTLDQLKAFWSSL